MQMPLHPLSPAPGTKALLLTDALILWYLNIFLPTARRVTSLCVQQPWAAWGLGEPVCPLWAIVCPLSPPQTHPQDRDATCG